MKYRITFDLDKGVLDERCPYIANLSAMTRSPGDNVETDNDIVYLVIHARAWGGTLLVSQPRHILTHYTYHS